MAIINSTETEIYNLLMAMEAADFERGELLDGLNFDVEDSIKIINDRAKKRLQDYKRRLIKAYNYRLLIPYSGSYELEKLEEQFKEFSRSNGETIDIKFVKRSYYEDLNQIADGILQSLDTGAVREYETSVSYELNINELATLIQEKESILIQSLKD